MKYRSSVRTLIKVVDSRDDITSLKTQTTKLESTINTVEKSITDKVWQNEIEAAVNDYDQTTIKTIRDTVSEHEVSIGKITDTVSSVESTLVTKADGSTVTELEERVSKSEQDVEGFKQTVSETYLPKGDLSLAFRNRIRRSKTMLYDKYGFTSEDAYSYVGDENFNILTDENYNKLIF